MTTFWIVVSCVVVLSLLIALILVNYNTRCQECKVICTELIYILMNHNDTKNSAELDGLCHLVASGRYYLIGVYEAGRFHRKHVDMMWKDVAVKYLSDYKSNKINLAQLQGMCKSMLDKISRERIKENC